MLSTVDLIVLIVSVIAVMVIGIIASRKEDTAEDFFLAGRSVRWWGVAGSIFGSNVSANHLIGMLGIGYSIGFADYRWSLVGCSVGVTRDTNHHALAHRHGRASREHERHRQVNHHRRGKRIDDLVQQGEFEARRREIVLFEIADMSQQPAGRQRLGLHRRGLHQIG